MAGRDESKAMSVRASRETFNLPAAHELGTSGYLAYSVTIMDKDTPHKGRNFEKRPEFLIPFVC